METLIQKALTATLALVTTWHWYDKTQRDKRFTAVETRIQTLEDGLGGTKIQIKGLEGKIETLQQLNTEKFKGLENSNTRIENKLDRILDPHYRRRPDEQSSG